MDNQFAKHETDYIKIYSKQGYTENFRIEGEDLISSETGRKYKPKDVFIYKEHRFEGMSNPSDLSLLYVLTTFDESKGTLLAAYGPNGDLNIHEFMKAVPEANRIVEENTPPEME